MPQTLTPLHLAEFSFNLGESASVIIPLAALILGGVIVVSALYFHNRRRELWHQTARLALEKGQPLPILPDDDTPRSADSGSAANDIRAGLVLIAVGVGLYLFLGNFISRALGYVGAIPGFIGVALLLFGTVRALTQSKKTSHKEHSAQP